MPSACHCELTMFKNIGEVQTIMDEKKKKIIIVQADPNNKLIKTIYGKMP